MTWGAPKPEPFVARPRLLRRPRAPRAGRRRGHAAHGRGARAGGRVARPSCRRNGRRPRRRRQPALRVRRLDARAPPGGLPGAAVSRPPDLGVAPCGAGLARARTRDDHDRRRLPHARPATSHRRPRVGPGGARLLGLGLDHEVERRADARRGKRHPGGADGAVGPRGRDRRRTALRARGGGAATSSPSTWAGRAPTSGSSARAGSSTCPTSSSSSGCRSPRPQSTWSRSAPAAGRSPGWTTAGCSGSGRGAPGPSPGPACYALGGTERTVTDANLVLGRIDADSLLGGRLPLDPEAGARRARTARGASSSSTPLPLRRR